MATEEQIEKAKGYLSNSMLCLPRYHEIDPAEAMARIEFEFDELPSNVQHEMAKYMVESTDLLEVGDREEKEAQEKKNRNKYAGKFVFKM